jgi:hypothetical protein
MKIHLSLLAFVRRRHLFAVVHRHFHWIENQENCALSSRNHHRQDGLAMFLGVFRNGLLI